MPHTGDSVRTLQWLWTPMFGTGLWSLHYSASPSTLGLCCPLPVFELASDWGSSSSVVWQDLFKTSKKTRKSPEKDYHKFLAHNITIDRNLKRGTTTASLVYQSNNWLYMQSVGAQGRKAFEKTQLQYNVNSPRPGVLENHQHHRMLSFRRPRFEHLQIQTFYRN